MKYKGYIFDENGEAIPFDFKLLKNELFSDMSLMTFNTLMREKIKSEGYTYYLYLLKDGDKNA